MAAYDYDAIVVGSGPNGFGTAITLAKAGLSVCMYEARDSVGGGLRSLELTQPGYVHDICSAVHPMALASPFFRDLPLDEHGLEWIQPDLPMAHPFDDGTAAILHRSIERTAETLHQDARAYRWLMTPVVDSWEKLQHDILGPFKIPKSPFILARFGINALLPARILNKLYFRGERARGFFAGLAAHSILPLERPISASFGLVLGAMAHYVGWPIPRGGSQSIADALASYFRLLGGQIVLNETVTSLDHLPRARVYLLDVTPRQLLAIAGDQFSEPYKQRLQRYRYGPGVYKVDWALDEPIPWKAETCSKAGTVHLGSTFSEISLSERLVWQGAVAPRPFVLLAQQSLFDPTRAPSGKHTAWAYCHVPHGDSRDLLDQVEGQVERFAPGFREIVTARSIMHTGDYEAYNANYIGGDINGGTQDIFQLFTRPNIQISPYRTSAKQIYLCSSSTPPGGGVHGMCGYHAAQVAMRDLKLV